MLYLKIPINTYVMVGPLLRVFVARIDTVSNPKTPSYSHRVAVLEIAHATGWGGDGFDGSIPDKHTLTPEATIDFATGGDQGRITLYRIESRQVRLSFDVPDSVKVLRQATIDSLKSRGQDPWTAPRTPKKINKIEG
jgi:sRNA-binding carbon storage regulator CsrA